MSNPWSSLQTAIKARLAESAYLAEVPVVTEDAGDVATTAQMALAKGGILADGTSASGVAIAIVTFGMDGSEANTRGHFSGRTIMRLGIHEEVTTNRGDTGFGKPGLDVLYQVMSQLHGWRPNPGANPGRVIGFQAVEDPDEAVISWFLDVEFVQSLTLA